MKKKFTTTLDETIIENLKILAVKKHTSAANLIEKAVQKMLNKDDQ
jgi:predicted transcriptional regulator